MVTNARKLPCPQTQYLTCTPGTPSKASHGAHHRYSAYFTLHP